MSRTTSARVLRLVLSDGETITPVQLAELTGMTADAAAQALRRLMLRGLIERVAFGFYARPKSPERDVQMEAGHA